jgi:GNAT superfamily N-acetyltransferase
MRFIHFYKIPQSGIREMVQLWNEEMGQEFPMRDSLFQQNSLRDINILHDGSFVALDHNCALSGFVICKYFVEQGRVQLTGDTGWIQVLLVKKSMRRQGIGTALLERAEQALKKKGARRIVLGKDVWHYFPGIPDQYGPVKQWFTAKGYICDGLEYDLLIERPDSQIPEMKGILFSLAEKNNEQAALLRFLHDYFPGRWEYEAIKYFERGGSGREFIILKKEKQIIAFCRMNDPASEQIAPNIYWSPLFNDQLGGIGPLGVRASDRGKGYGLAIVKTAVALLAERGLKYIVIDWTQLVNFYEQTGTSPWKIYATYSKRIQA